ncbi:MAG: hypothetical protein HC918_03480 [Oscillatoriales cyanobacterium SM2_1_8]|nr:hypothetical protein [Oscillatoriales cyanobacterium SM2_1_8]
MDRKQRILEHVQRTSEASAEYARNANPQNLRGEERKARILEHVRKTAG